MPAAERRNAAGFSLIEIVVVLALLSLVAGAASSVALRATRGNLKERTLVPMREIVTAMLGDPSRGDFGYLGDMGELPDSALTQLFVRGAQQPALADPVDGIVSGYNGPYILNSGTAATGFVDFWSSAFQYTPGTAQLTSLGPDRTLGTADDIVYPSAAPLLSGTVTVVVKGLLAAGGPPIQLRSDEASVAVFHTRASDNTRAQIATSYTGAQGSGIWLSAAVHLGLHGVAVTGLDASGSGGHDFSGSVSRALVAVIRGPAVVEVLLEESP
jgi:prepilin-type N-terminal cleavage/methylation domain-containing protein